MISIKLQSNFIEITLRHACSPVNLLHISRTPFYKNTSGRLLLHLVKSVLPKINVAVNSGQCGEKWPPCELCKLKKSSAFNRRNSEENYHIHKPLNCNFKNKLYLIEYSQCWKQSTGSSNTNFCYRANNYKSAYSKIKNKEKVSKEALKQKNFSSILCSALAHFLASAFKIFP